MAGVLRLLYGLSRSVTIEEMAVGREQGRARLMINVDNPTGPDNAYVILLYKILGNVTLLTRP